MPRSSVFLQPLVTLYLAPCAATSAAGLVNLVSALWLKAAVTLNRQGEVWAGQSCRNSAFVAAKSRSNERFRIIANAASVPAVQPAATSLGQCRPKIIRFSAIPTQYMALVAVGFPKVQHGQRQLHINVLEAKAPVGRRSQDEGIGSKRRTVVLPSQ